MSDSDTFAIEELEEIVKHQYEDCVDQVKEIDQLTAENKRLKGGLRAIVKRMKGTADWSRTIDRSNSPYTPLIDDLLAIAKQALKGD